MRLLEKEEYKKIIINSLQGLRSAQGKRINNAGGRDTFGDTIFYNPRKKHREAARYVTAKLDLNDQEEINIKQLIEEKLLFFQELIQKRNLTVHASLSLMSVFSSRELLEILINNFFSNAIRHNYEEGLINIDLRNNSLSFCNSSNYPALDHEKIFERFYKGTSTDGTGLGLSILKQICNRQDFHLIYIYEQNLHCFQITFN